MPTRSYKSMAIFLILSTHGAFCAELSTQNERFERKIFRALQEICPIKKVLEQVHRGLNLSSQQEMATVDSTLAKLETHYMIQSIPYKNHTMEFTAFIHHLAEQKKLGRYALHIDNALKCEYSRQTTMYETSYPSLYTYNIDILKNMSVMLKKECKTPPSLQEIIIQCIESKKIPTGLMPEAIKAQFDLN